MSNLPEEILIIDDDSTVAQSVEGPMSSYHVAVSSSQDLETAFYYFNNQDFDVVIVEIDFEPLHGLALIQKFRQHDSVEKRATAFILTSGKTRSPADENLMKQLLDIELLLKPFNTIKLLPYLSRGMATKQRLLKFEKFRDKLKTKVAAGDQETAISEVKKELPKLGGKGIQLICELYEEAKDFQAGLDFITPISEKEPATMLYQYLRGRFLFLLGRSEEAQQFLEKVYQASPHHIQCLQDIGELYLSLDQPDDAVGKMKELLDLNPENQDVKFDMFQKLHDAGYDEHAQKFCKETTKPQEVVRYYNNKGVELSRSGDINGAITQYKQAIQYFPDFKENYRIHYNIALALVKFKTKDAYLEAIEHLEKCLDLVPDFEKAHNTLETLNKVVKKNKAAS